jgi:hypothetical protein
MADSAARLVDSVLPDVPLRQWVLSLPFDLRLVAAMRADVLRDIVRIFVQAIFRGMRRRLRMPGAAAGAIAATHHAGGAWNLNVHWHVLACDGVFVRHPAGGVGFHRAPAPSPNDLAELVGALRRRVLRRLARMGLLRDERLTAQGSNETPDLGALEACETLALRAGEFEAHDGAKADPEDLPPGRRSSRWSAQLRYLGVFAANSPWRSSIIPRPPENDAGCHHGHAASAPAPSPAATDVPAPSPDPLFAVPQPVPRALSPEHWRRLDDGRLLARQPRVDWASLLRRSFLQDVLCCPRCCGRMAVIEPVTEPDDIRRSLAALGLRAARPRAPQTEHEHGGRTITPWVKTRQRSGSPEPKSYR